MKYNYINTFTTHPGKRAELKTILLEAAQALQSNPDCLQYLIGTTETPDELYVNELWTSKQSHDGSLEPAEVKAIIARAMPLIAGINKVAELHIEGGKE